VRLSLLLLLVQLLGLVLRKRKKTITNIKLVTVVLAF
jgi:hypothetical protein